MPSKSASACQGFRETLCQVSLQVLWAQDSRSAMFATEITDFFYTDTNFFGQPNFCQIEYPSWLKERGDIIGSTDYENNNCEVEV